jgi:hypothetical protein
MSNIMTVSPVGPRFSVRGDRRTDVMMLIVAFDNFATKMKLKSVQGFSSYRAVSTISVIKVNQLMFKWYNSVSSQIDKEYLNAMWAETGIFVC